MLSFEIFFGYLLMGKLNRRDFLKLAAILPATAYLQSAVPYLGHVKSKNGNALPNVIIFVFDAMSARNLSLYGYPRKTTPNFERFAERAIVYHSHYSAGNYTTPGTASLLTGMYPWTHRAINQSGEVVSSLTKRNIFNLIGDEYNRYAYGQNSWANIFLNQFDADIDYHLPVRSFGTVSPWLTGDVLNDANLGHQAFDYFLFSKGDPPASLVIGSAERLYGFDKTRNLKTKDYPRGLPEVVTGPFYYRLDDLFSGLGSTCAQLQSPFIAYFHVHPPHEPYKPTRNFSRYFIDDWVPLAKPAHRLVIIGRETEHEINQHRANYDRFIANLDAEFGHMLNELEPSGIFNKSYVILTSDHGDMFERGQRGHSTPLLYDPIIHIPLLISTPGQKSRKDIYSPTNCVDILPTLLQLGGRETPNWCVGKPLPVLGGSEDHQRSTYSVEAKQNSTFAPLRKATIAMQKGKYKIIYYMGYEKEDTFELYDLESDPEEMVNLFSSRTTLATSLADELISALKSANSSFEG
jgi:arylsulfatase A-like enzyme